MMTRLAAILLCGALAACASPVSPDRRASRSLDGTSSVEVRVPSDRTSTPALLAYFDRVGQAIGTHWVYPKAALDRRSRGTVGVEFTVLANGSLKDVRVTRSSGDDILDQETVRAVTAAAPFEPFPADVEKRELLVRADFQYVD